MTLDEAIKIIKSECYIADLLNLDRTQMVNTALDTVIEALSEEEKEMPLICLRCKKNIPLSMPTFKEISYTHYSYCEECLRKGLKALKVWDKVYQQIYDHHYEILKEEASEGRNAKLSLSNWVLDLLTGYDIKGEEVGKWIEKDVDYYKAVNEYGGGVNEDTPYFVDDIACSKCLKLFSVIDNETERFNYCPNCGAKMAEESDEE